MKNSYYTIPPTSTILLRIHENFFMEYTGSLEITNQIQPFHKGKNILSKNEILCIEYIYFYEVWQTLFFGAPKSLQIVTAAMKLKDAYSLEEKL